MPKKAAGSSRGKEKKFSKKKVTQKVTAIQKKLVAQKKVASEKAMGEEIGKIIGFFAIPSAAIIKIKKGSLKVGDTLWIRGHTTDLKETIQSMQIDRKPISAAKKGAEVGVHVSKRVRRNDRVYKIESA